MIMLFYDDIVDIILFVVDYLLALFLCSIFDNCYFCNPIDNFQSFYSRWTWIFTLCEYSVATDLYHQALFLKKQSDYKNIKIKMSPLLWLARGV